MEPAVIVPDSMAEPVVVADAGSIVRLMDQSQLYREWVSPITRRVDERLVQYGTPKKLLMGWISSPMNSHKHVKPVKGPTFLVRTKAEDALSAWERLRLLVANARKRDARYNLATWLATHGEHAEHQKLLREVTREFGSTTVKNEPFADRFQRLCSLILHTTELDMASKKLKKTGKTAKGKKTVVEETSAKKSKKTAAKDKSAKAKKASEFSSRGHDFDNHVIRRLIKENPRRAGTEKAKIWDRIRKGMTVAEFCKKGGSRGAVGRYITNGWIKLLPPSTAPDAE